MRNILRQSCRNNKPTPKQVPDLRNIDKRVRVAHRGDELDVAVGGDRVGQLARHSRRRQRRRRRRQFVAAVCIGR